jgi:membrane-bound serine protease (ClpP class)
MTFLRVRAHEITVILRNLGSRRLRRRDVALCWSGRCALWAQLLALVAVALGLLAMPAGAQEDEAPARIVDVVEVSGYIDPVVADFLGDAIDQAEEDDVEALVVQLNSPGDLLPDDELEALARRVAEARVPVAVWVGPSGAEATGGAARLVTEAALKGMAPGTTYGDEPQGPGAEVPDELRVGTVGPEEAFEAELVDLNQEEAATLGTFVAGLDGKEANGRELDTATFTEQDEGPPDADLTVQTRLSKLPLWDRIFHTAASPAIAYLFLCAGLVLLVFEFFTAGVGIAGLTGALSLVLAAYGLTVLPTRPLGLALCVLGVFGFAVDIQTGAPRVWTGIGTVSFVAGSLLLYEEGIRVGWIPLVAGVAGVVLLMLAGLPATVRSRFSTPTIGRATLIGEMGTAVADLRPEGVVSVRDALWPARTNRATPIAAGDRVRVVSVEGTSLEVEPEVGGAKDHRERRGGAQDRH